MSTNNLAAALLKELHLETHRIIQERCDINQVSKEPVEVEFLKALNKGILDELQSIFSQSIEKLLKPRDLIRVDFVDDISADDNSVLVKSKPLRTDRMKIMDRSVTRLAGGVSINEDMTCLTVYPKVKASESNAITEKRRGRPYKINPQVKYYRHDSSASSCNQLEDSIDQIQALRSRDSENPSERGGGNKRKRVRPRKYDEYVSSPSEQDMTTASEAKRRRWTYQEDELIRKYTFNEKVDWQSIATELNRSVCACRMRHYTMQRPAASDTSSCTSSSCSVYSCCSPVDPSLM